MQNIPKGLLMITLTFLFTLTIAGAAFAATGDQVTNAILTPNTLPLVNSNSTQGGNDQFVVNSTPVQGFPTNGSSYANINTGNDSESYANLTLNLTIPQGAKTLSFDWRFATNETINYYSSIFPDWAKAEIIDGNSITNILLLPNGNTVDVLNASSYLSPTNPNNIGYNTTTPMYTTTTDISAYAGKNILLVFSIADAKDKLYTSALFIDNLHIEPIADLNLNMYTNDGNNWNYHTQHTFYLNLTNKGGTASNVVLTDILPPGLQFVSASDGGSYSGGVITWNIGTLNAGASILRSITVYVTGHNIMATNTATATTSTYEANTNDNTDSVTINVPAAAHADVETFFADYNQFVNNGYTIVPITTANYHDYVLIMLSLVNNGPDPITYSSILNSVNGLSEAREFYWSNNGGSWTHWTDNELDNEWDWYPTWDRTLNVGDSVMCAVVSRITSSNTTVTNTLTTTSQNPNDPSGYDVDSTDLQVPAAADIVVNKTWENTSGGRITDANYLDTVVAHLTVINNGPDNASNVVLTDHLPIGFQLNAAQSYVRYGQLDSSRWSLEGCTDWSYDQATGLFTWNITRHLGDALYSGLANACEVWLYFTNTAHNNTQVLNTAEVDPQSLGQYDQNQTNNVATDSYTANAAAHIDLDTFYADYDQFINNAYNIVQVNTANYLDNVITILSATNNGPDTVTSASGIIHWPAELSLSGYYWRAADGTWSPFMGYSGSGDIPWAITMFGNPLNPGETFLVALVGQVSDFNTTATNTIETISQTPTGVDGFDSASTTLQIPAAADVTVTKEFRTDYQNSTSTTNTANYHTPVWVMVHVTNAGPDAVDGLQVVDVLPAGLTYLSEYFVSHDGGLTWVAMDVYNATTGVWNIGSVLNGADYWLAVLAQVDGHNTTITNAANKTQSTFDWNATNDNGNATLTVPAAADVYVNTSTSKNNPAVGEEVVVRVKAGNNGPDTAQNIVVTYKVPEGMEFVSLAWETGYPAPVYDPTTRTVTWNLGNLAVIDPWMDITLRAASAGATSGDASVTSDTYDPVSENNLESGAISVEQAQVKAATVDSTVPMQKTGVPIGMILTALLLLVTGLVMPRRK